MWWSRGRNNWFSESAFLAIRLGTRQSPSSCECDLPMVCLAWSAGGGRYLSHGCSQMSFFCRWKRAFSLLLFGMCSRELTSSLAISLVEYCVLAHCFQSLNSVPQTFHVLQTFAASPFSDPIQLDNPDPQPIIDGEEGLIWVIGPVLAVVFIICIVIAILLYKK